MGGREPQPAGGVAGMVKKREGWEEAGALMVALVGDGEGSGSRPTAPDRRMDRGDPLAGVGTRSRSTGCPMRGRLEVGRGRALPARAGAGAGGTDGPDSTTRSSGPCGSLGATRAAGSGG